MPCGPPKCIILYFGSKKIQYKSDMSKKFSP
jgi:hypothetical protein